MTQPNKRPRFRFLAMLMALSFVLLLFSPYEQLRAQEATASQTQGETGSSDPRYLQLEKQLMNLGYLAEGEQLATKSGELPVVITLTDEQGFTGDVAGKMAYAQALRQSFLAKVSAQLNLDLELEGETSLLNVSMATTVPVESLAKLFSFEEVKGIYSNASFLLAPQAIVRNQNPMFRSATEVYDPSTLKGQGQLVAVLDSGFDTDHKNMYITDATKAHYPTSESVAGVIQTNRLAGQWKNTKFPYVYNYANQDQDVEETGESHGTHVAGIVAAQPDENGQFAGGAPEAQVLAMRVFRRGAKSTSPYTYSKAIEDSVVLGAKSINMSLGSAYGVLKQMADFILEQIQNARRQGVMVNIAAGNEGYASQAVGLPEASQPHYETVGDPAVATDALAVASMNNLNITTTVFDVENDGQRGYLAGAVVPVAPLYDEWLEIVPVGLARPEDVEGLNLEGKAALIERGLITFVSKVNTVAEKGAKLAIIYNSEAGGEDYVSMALDGTNIPAISVKRSDGVGLRANPARIRLTKGVGSLSYGAGGRASDFSSWGPSPEFDLKPEVMAVGGNVYSTLPDDTYGNQSGTSMATPQVSALVALFNERIAKDADLLVPAVGEARQDFVKNFVMSTAVPQAQDNDPFLSPRKQGAGLANRDNLLSSTVIVTALPNDQGKLQAKVNLGDVQDQFSFKVRVHNVSKTKTHRFSSAEATVQTDRLDENNPKWIVVEGTRKIVDNVPADVQSFSLAPGETKDLTFNVDLSAVSAQLAREFINGYYVEGFVRLTSENPAEQSQVGLPWIAFHEVQQADGSTTGYKDIPVIEKPIYDYEDVSENSDELPYFYSLMDQTSHPYTALITEVNGQKVVLGEVEPDADGRRQFKTDPFYLSPNFDRVYDKVQFQAVFRSHFEKAVMKVWNEDRSEVQYESDPVGGSLNQYEQGEPSSAKNIPTRRYAWSWSGRKGFSPLPDGIYWLDFQAQGIMEGAKPQKLSFKIVLDTKAPKLSQVRYQDGRFTAVISDENGIKHAYLERIDAQGESQEVMQNNLTDSVSFEVAEQDLSQYRVVMYDPAGNKTVKRLDHALESATGEFTARFKKHGTDEVIDLDPSHYTITVKDELGSKYEQWSDLPFGRYTATLELKTAKYSADQATVNFELTREEPIKTVDFFLRTLDVVPLEVTVNFAPEGVSYPSTPKMRAVLEDGSTVVELKYVDLFGKLFMFEGELSEGTWRLEAYDLEEGWQVNPSVSYVTVEDGDWDASAEVTYINGPTSSIEVVSTITGGSLTPDDLVYQAYDGVTVFNDLSVLPLGNYLVVPAMVPDGYYVKPDRVLLTLEEDEVARPEFVYSPLTEETYGRVVVRTVMEDPNEAVIEASYKASNLYGKGADTLDKIPYGGWYVEPDQHSPLFVGVKENEFVFVDEGTPEVHVDFVWKRLSSIEKSGIARIDLDWEDKDAKKAHEEGANPAYHFEFTNLDTGEVLTYSGAREWRGVDLPNVPFGYYAVRLTSPEGVHAKPVYVAVKSDEEPNSAGEKMLIKQGAAPEHYTLPTKSLPETPELEQSVTLQLPGTTGLSTEGLYLWVEAKGDSVYQLNGADYRVSLYDVEIRSEATDKKVPNEDLPLDFQATLLLPLGTHSATEAKAVYVNEANQISEHSASAVLGAQMSLQVRHFSLYGVASPKAEPTPTPTIAPTATPEPTVTVTPVVTPSPTLEPTTGAKVTPAAPTSSAGTATGGNASLPKSGEAGGQTALVLLMMGLALAFIAYRKTER